MICLSRIDIKPFTPGNGFIISCNVDGGPVDKLWFSCYFQPPNDTSRFADAFVLPAIVYGLATGKNVKFDFSVSTRLLESTRSALCPLLLRFAPDLFKKTIKIFASELSDDTGPRLDGAATGMSCGLDSFASVAWMRSCSSSSQLRLSALSHFDTGNHSPLPDTAKTLYQARLDRAHAVSARLDLPLLEVRSNMNDWFPGRFSRLHTLRNAAAAYLLSGNVGTYVYANGVRIQDTTLNALDSACIDAVILPLLNTGNIEFIQGTPSWGAMFKTEAIASDPVAREYLNVCFFSESNCGECEKCLRRALLLDACKALDDFSKVFEPYRFRKNKDWYIGFLIGRQQSSPAAKEIIDSLFESGYLSKDIWRYRLSWLCRRSENLALRILGKPRRPL